MGDSSGTLRDPSPGESCRVCRAPLSSAGGRCEACGTVHGETFRCPHCGAIADIDPHPVLRQRCRVCGGPRVPAEGLQLRTAHEANLLRKAARARSASIAWRLGALTVLTFGLVGIIVALAVIAIANLGVATILMLVLMLGTPGLGALFAWRQGARNRADLRRALDAAWVSVAAELLRELPTELTAEELGERMRLTAAQAEALLARLGAEDKVRMRVSDDGRLLFSGETAQKLRVSSDAPSTELLDPEEAEAIARRSRTRGE